MQQQLTKLLPMTYDMPFFKKNKAKGISKFTNNKHKKENEWFTNDDRVQF